MAGAAVREHGTLAKYHLDACRCSPCRLESRRYEQNRARAIAYGTWQPYVDAEPVRAHVRALADFGIGWMRLAAIAGVSRGGVSKLIYGDSRRGMAPSRRVRPETARALLAVEPLLEHLGSGVLVNGTGTRRRLRALVAAGWPQYRLALRLGMHPSNFRGTLLRDEVQVRVGTLRAVRGLYDALWRVDPREEGVRPHVYARARKEAAAAGWAPVLAWDDETIDDPAALPDWTGRCGTPQGRRDHHRLGIPVCPPCRQARSPRYQNTLPVGAGRGHERSAA